MGPGPCPAPSSPLCLPLQPSPFLPCPLPPSPSMPCPLQPSVPHPLCPTRSLPLPLPRHPHLQPTAGPAAAGEFPPGSGKFPMYMKAGPLRLGYLTVNSECGGSSSGHRQWARRRRGCPATTPGSGGSAWERRGPELAGFDPGPAAGCAADMASIRGLFRGASLSLTGFSSRACWSRSLLG